LLILGYPSFLGTKYIINPSPTGNPTKTSINSPMSKNVSIEFSCYFLVSTLVRICNSCQFHLYINYSLFSFLCLDTVHRTAPAGGNARQPANEQEHVLAAVFCRVII